MVQYFRVKSRGRPTIGRFTKYLYRWNLAFFKSFPPLLNLLLVIYYYFGLDVEFHNYIFITLSLMLHDPDLFVYLVIYDFE